MTTPDNTSVPTTGVAESSLLDGRVRLLQPRHGYRAGMDAALLAAAVAARPAQRILEAGCGVGAVLMQVASRRPEVELTGIERDEAAAGIARQNAALNGVADCTTIITGDVSQAFGGSVTSAGSPPPSPLTPELRNQTFDWAISNPPYFDDPGELRLPSPEKRGAWLADDGLAAWCNFLTRAVRDGGSIVMIHRADRLADLLSLLSAKSGSFVIRPVQPFSAAPAKRVIIKAIRGGRAPLRLLPPLVLHDRSGSKHTPEAEAILRGSAALDM
jgi:tRNA1(Val) A37 N6-methylase TrmN6